MRRLAVASLFPGAGGLDLGFVQTGSYALAFSNDISEPALETHSKNLGLKLRNCSSGTAEAEVGTALACDVARVDFTPLRDAGVEVLVGGPPCQDFSIVRGT